MVRFVVSSTIRRAIQDYNKKKGFAHSDDGYINPEANSIEHLQLARIASTLHSSAEVANKPDYSLNTMLKSTTLYIEPKPESKPVSRDRTPAADVNRIQNIGRGWTLCARGWKNKNIIPWFVMLSRHLRHPYSPMTTILLTKPRWSKTNCQRSSTFCYR